MAEYGSAGLYSGGATLEVEMGRMEVRGLPMQKHQTLSEKQMKSKKD
jgi:hypothetical protein